MVWRDSPRLSLHGNLRLGAGNILLSPRVLKVRLGIVIGIQPGAAGDRNVGTPWKIKKTLGTSLNIPYGNAHVPVRE